MLVTESDDLARECKRLRRCEYIAVDTEFIRENTFRPQLCLIQLCGPERRPVLIDPFANLDLQPFFQLLLAPEVLKVFHAGRQDIEIFYHLMGGIPAPVFDTQVAAMVCGFGDQVGFSTLASSLADVTLDKSPQYSDWSLRPLSRHQLSYAVADVVHLCTVYERLLARLGRNGRRRWLAEEMTTLTSESTYVSDPDLAWKRIKHRKMSARALVILRELAKWREMAAERLNLPRVRVARDETLVEIATAAPKTRAGLRRVRGVTRTLAGGPEADRILEAVQTGLAVPRHALPKPKRRPEGSPVSGELTALLQALLKTRCEEHDVAQRLIATKSDLEAIAADSDADVPALRGWRRELFGEDALALKEGKIALTGAGGQVQVTSV